VQCHSLCACGNESACQMGLAAAASPLSPAAAHLSATAWLGGQIARPNDKRAHACARAASTVLILQRALQRVKAQPPNLPLQSNIYQVQQRVTSRQALARGP
jgi:hypothetical protein